MSEVLVSGGFDLMYLLLYALWEICGWWEGAGRGEIVLQCCIMCGVV